MLLLHGGDLGWQFVQDMLRATVVVDSVDDLWTAYECINHSDWFTVTSIRAEKLQTALKEVKINIDFMGCMIGEIKLTFGHLTP